MNKHYELLDKLEHCLADLKQTTLAGPNYNEVNDLCSEWLKLNGYSVKKPIEYPTKIKGLDDLISLFYLLFEKYYPEFSAPYNNTNRDRKIAKLFIETRMKADGISKAKALDQCATIIETLFKYRDDFNFDPAPSFGVFGQQNMSWITNKTLEYINKEREEIEERRAEMMADEQTARLEASGMQFGWSDEEIDEMHKRIGGKDV